MKQNYELEGMSCGGCVNSVKKALLQMSDVARVPRQKVINSHNLMAIGQNAVT